MLSKPCAVICLYLPLLSLAGTPLGIGGGPLEAEPRNVHGKRSFYVSPTCAGTWCPWPDKKLTWCQEGDTKDQGLQDLWGQAWDKWTAAFGGADRSGLTTSYEGLCKDDKDGKHLHITLTTEKRAGTTVGYRKPGFTDKGEPNHVMRIDLSAEWGTLNPASNLAHEMGHAFGLLHEHQKWMAWNPDRLSDPPRNDPLIKLNCENLYDYDDFKSRGEPVDDLCKSMFFSAGRGFSAADFLPWPQATTHEQSPDFDWNSIMMYASNSGSKAADKPTLVKFNGDLIGRILEPSGRDGEAIRALYPA